MAMLLTGNSVDLSHAIMDRAILHSDGTYHIPNVRIRGRLCHTNQPSNTAFRGFGGPQGMLIANTWMEHLARELGMPFESVQERNMYPEGATTHFGQVLEANRLKDCWQAAMEMADWGNRQASVDAFNAGSRCALLLPNCAHNNA